MTLVRVSFVSMALMSMTFVSLVFTRMALVRMALVLRVVVSVSELLLVATLPTLATLGATIATSTGCARGAFAT
jgi:hypothetical protein